MSERYFRISDTPLPVLSERDQRRLLSVLEWAEQYFSNKLAGNALNGANDDVFLGADANGPLSFVAEKPA